MSKACLSLEGIIEPRLKPAEERKQCKILSAEPISPEEKVREELGALKAIFMSMGVVESSFTEQKFRD